MPATMHAPKHERGAKMVASLPESSTSSCIRRTSRSKVPRMVPPLLQGRDGSHWSPSGAASHGDRPVVLKLSFSGEGEGRGGCKRKTVDSPSFTDDDESGGDSRDSRSTEVSSAGVFRTSSSQVDRSAVVLVTRNLRLRRDSAASSGSGSDLSSRSQAADTIADAGRQSSGATPCSTLRSDAAFACPASPEGASPRAGTGACDGAVGAASPSPPVAQLSLREWAAAMRQGRSIKNPLARPPLRLTAPGAINLPCALLQEQASPVQQQAATKLSALEAMLQCVAAAEHRARTAAMSHDN